MADWTQRYTDRIDALHFFHSAVSASRTGVISTSRRFAGLDRDVSSTGKRQFAGALVSSANERRARGRYLTGGALGVASGVKGEEGHAALQSYR